jgi:hypothetical protein
MDIKEIGIGTRNCLIRLRIGIDPAHLNLLDLITLTKLIINY